MLVGGCWWQVDGCGKKRGGGLSHTGRDEDVGLDGPLLGLGQLGHGLGEVDVLGEVVEDVVEGLAALLVLLLLGVMVRG